MNNDNENAEQSATQERHILTHLNKGNRITSLEALNKFGCMRLASRISDLRLKSKIDIESRYIKLPNGKRVKEYFINQ